MAPLDFGQLLQSFANDGKLKAVLILIAVDFFIGVCAAIKMGTFRFSYLADFMRRDILGKVIPWFVLYSAGKLTSKSPIPDINFDTLATSVFGIIVAALAASIMASLLQLGLTKEEAKQNASGQVQPTGIKAVLAPENPAAGHG